MDNGSPGEAASRIARRYGARVVRLGENLGFAAGANAGARQATGDVVAFLNDDAVAGDGWLASAARALEDPTVAAVGPKLVFTGRYLEIHLDDETWWAPGDPRPLGRQLVSVSLSGRDVLPYLVGRGIHRLETPQVVGPRRRTGSQVGGLPRRWRWAAGGGEPFYVPLPPGSQPVELTVNGEAVRPRRVVDLIDSIGCYLSEDGHVGDIGADVSDEPEFDTWEERFAISRTAFVTTSEVLAKVGRFEPRYFASYEDADWCWRARLRGYRVLFDPTVTVRHERGTTSSGVLSRRAHFLAERNRLLTLLRNAPSEVALRETWRTRRGGGDDGVAEAIPRFLPRALGERAVLRRSWVLGPHEVADRWAGVDAPPRSG